MNIEIIVQNTTTGKAYEIADLVEEISIAEFMEESPGKLTLTANNILNGDYITEGSPLSLKVNGKGVFFGYAFKIEKNKNKELKITAYDQKRYLKFKDTYVLQGLTASQIFSKVCVDYNIKNKVVAKSNYVLPDKIEDNKNLYEIIQNALDKVLIDKKEWLFIRDNFGTLELLSVSDEKTTLAIGDESLLNEYDYSSSIDDETYNQVKLIKENKKTKKREIYIVKDSKNIKKWGTLQYFDKVDEKMNEAQIKQKAEQLLKFYNKPKKTLKLECIGDFRVRAGSGIVLLIDDLKTDVPYNKYAVVLEVTHKIGNNSHFMSLTVEVM
ncbi:MAG: XkdQ/YqbQ family protein [Clostridium sp.]